MCSLERNPGMSHLPLSLQVLSKHEQCRGQFCTLCGKYISRLQWRNVNQKPLWLVEHPSLCKELYDKLEEEEKGSGFCIDDQRQASSLCVLCHLWLQRSDGRSSSAVTKCLAHLHALSKEKNVHSRRVAECGGNCAFCTGTKSRSPSASLMTIARSARPPADPAVEEPSIPSIATSILVTARAESGMSISQCSRFLASVDRQCGSTLQSGFEQRALERNGM